MPAVHGPRSTPARRRPAYEMKRITSSGVLRNTSTYTPPTRCNQTSGAIRKAATSVPTTMAITNENTTRRTVTQNPARSSSRLSMRTLMRSPMRLRGRLDRLLERHRRRLLLLVGVLADPLVVGLGPAAAALVLLQDAVDELLELRVVLREPRAVRLGGERVALDELERLVLDDHAGEDHVVGRDRVDGAVLHQLEALRVGVDEPQVGVRGLLLERLLVGRAEGRADLLAREVVDARDVRVLRHEDPPPGYVVRLGQP